MSPARHHAEWLSLVETSGPFLSLDVLLREFPQELDTFPLESAREWKLAYDEWQDDKDKVRPDPAIHNRWIGYVVDTILGFDVTETIREGQTIPDALHLTVPEHLERLAPDIMICVPSGEPDAGKPRLLICKYHSSQSLEESIDGKAWMASPKDRMVELLRGTSKKLGLVTNGEHWLLVSNCADTIGFASWYSALWREEPLTLRAFISLLSQRRFFGVPLESTFEALLKASAEDQAEITTQLGNQVRSAVEVLVQSIDRIDKDHGRKLLEEFDEKRLYEAALTVMMRLVFLFSSEERGLLLLGDETYDENYAVSTLRAQLREAADQQGEEVLERRCDAWSRLLATFRAVFGGVDHEGMRLPAYGGNLFDPDKYPFLEGREPGSTWREVDAKPLQIDNRTVLHLLYALQILQVKIPGGGPAEARRLSFRALDIEQIGHVYEGLLDHTAVRASEPLLGFQCAKGRDAQVELSKLETLRQKSELDLIKFLHEATGRTPKALAKAMAAGVGLEDAHVLLTACGNDPSLYAKVAPFAGLLLYDSFGKPFVITEGTVYVSKGTDRRSSGTHYTPRSLTEPIVKRTLDPLLYAGMADGVPPSPETLRTPKEILNLKICDMTVGSGAFLVQDCRYLSERLVEAWEREEKAHPGLVLKTPDGEFSVGSPAERLLPENREERLTIARRLIVDRCLYGVDKNPMAVEMAKLSLWLITLEKERPFTFLDHAIKCGDSLVGVSLDQLYSWSLTPKPKADTTYSLLEMLLKDDIETALSHRKDIALLKEETIADTQQKERLLAAADRAIDHARLAADLIVAPSFADDKPKDKKKKRNDFQHRFTSLGRQTNYHPVLRPSAAAPDDRDNLRNEANKMLGEVTPFHWPLEFPEVFAKERGGFDAIVGNPPFMGGRLMRAALGSACSKYVATEIGGPKGNAAADFVTYFFLRASQNIAKFGCIGLVATNTIAQGDTRQVGLEQLLGSGFEIYWAEPSFKWPGQANLEVAIVGLHNGAWKNKKTIAGNAVQHVSCYLDAEMQVANPVPLRANSKICYQGTIVNGKGFIVTHVEANRLLELNPANAHVIKPYLSGDDLYSDANHRPSRCVIDFGGMTEAEAKLFPQPFEVVEKLVKKERLAKSAEIAAAPWWQFWRRRAELYDAIRDRDQVIAKAIVSGTWAFVFVPTNYVYMHKICVFTTFGLAEFGCLQSLLHEAWATKYTSSLGRVNNMNYSPTDCFDNFALPNFNVTSSPALEDIGSRYYEDRRQVLQSRQMGLTDLSALIDDALNHDYDIVSNRKWLAQLDLAVLNAYGWSDIDLAHGFYGEGKDCRFTISPAAKQEVLRRLLKLNHERAAEEAAEAGRTTAEATVARLSAKRRVKLVNTNQAQVTMDAFDTSHVVGIQAPTLSVADGDIEPAILTWLVAREAAPEIVERHRPNTVRLKVYRPEVKRLRTIRLAKELYGIQEMVGVPVGSRFERENWGPLSTTFYDSVDEAVRRGWLIKLHDRSSKSDEYEVGPNAEDAVRLAYDVIGEHAQTAENMLFYVEGDKTIQAERQTTVHKAWSDLQGEGKSGTPNEVVAEVMAWKPDRPGFSKGEIRITYGDLKVRGFIT